MTFITTRLQTTRFGRIYGRFLALYTQFPHPKCVSPFVHLYARAHLKKQIITQGRIKEVPRWFPDVRLNYAENLLQWNNDKIAVVELGEHGKKAFYAFRELRALVRDMGSAMRAHGLRPGDRVGGTHQSSRPRVPNTVTLLDCLDRSYCRE